MPSATGGNLDLSQETNGADATKDTTALDGGTDAEIHFNGRGTADNGVKLHARVEPEGQNNHSVGEVGGGPIDESFLSLSGSYGEIILGGAGGTPVKVLTGLSGSWATGVGKTLNFDTGWVPKRAMECTAPTASRCAKVAVSSTPRRRRRRQLIGRAPSELMRRNRAFSCTAPVRTGRVPFRGKSSRGKPVDFLAFQPTDRGRRLRPVLQVPDRLFLMPRQHSGKPNLGKISRMGRRGFRRLLITGAMAVLRHAFRLDETSDGENQYCSTWGIA